MLGYIVINNHIARSRYGVTEGWLNLNNWTRISSLMAFTPMAQGSVNFTEGMEVLSSLHYTFACCFFFLHISNSHVIFNFS